MSMSSELIFYFSFGCLPAINYLSYQKEGTVDMRLFNGEVTFNEEPHFNEKVYREVKRYNRIRRKLELLTSQQRRMLVALYDPDYMASSKYLATNGKVNTIIKSKFPQVLVDLFGVRAGLALFTSFATFSSDQDFLKMLKDPDLLQSIKEEIKVLHQDLETSWKDLSHKEIT